ncbi:hypothetical protein EJ03DRAFT_352295 [Teratosphaeria nubilosa]|uniref:Uncharacterized protein n=1 Tax=Teratosphaeria nubilosa TaxID=161662 RepID=A0A6G1L823_9PEZI|nr:hypothetical protein EJ03DRAFT_352295 [Teratosphaeria nubilosa]
MGHGLTSAIRSHVVRLDENYDLDEHIQRVGLEKEDVQNVWLECPSTQPWEPRQTTCYRADLNGIILAAVHSDFKAHPDMAYEAPIYRPEDGCAIPDEHIIHLRKGQTMEKHMHAVEEWRQPGQRRVLTNENVKEILPSNVERPEDFVEKVHLWRRRGLGKRLTDEMMLTMFEMEKDLPKPLRYWAQLSPHELAAVRADPNVAKVVQTTECDPRGAVDHKVCLAPSYPLQSHRAARGRHLWDDVNMIEWHDDGDGVVYDAKLTLEGFYAISAVPGVSHVLSRVRTHPEKSLSDYIALYEDNSEDFTSIPKRHSSFEKSSRGSVDL